MKRLLLICIGQVCTSLGDLQTKAAVGVGFRHPDVGRTRLFVPTLKLSKINLSRLGHGIGKIVGSRRRTIVAIEIQVCALSKGIVA